MRIREARAFSRGLLVRPRRSAVRLTQRLGPLTVVCLGLSVLAVALGFGGCATRDDEAHHETRYEFAQAQMGLEFRFTLYASDAQTAGLAAEAACSRIAALNAVLSDYDADSELSRLSHSSGSGQWVRASDDLWRVLTAAQTLAAKSSGAFDISIGPSVNLWRRARRQQQFPDLKLLEQMRSRVGYQHVQLDPRRRAILLDRADMRLDAGGIAKGYALDEAMRILRAHGVKRAMIHAGGDMIFGDPPPRRTGWQIELTGHEAAADRPTLVLSRCALATSGDLFQFVELGGVRYSHIIDPRTGVGLTNRSLVHVIAPKGIDADGLSTAVSVLGSEKGMSLVRQFRGAEFRLTQSGIANPPVADSPGFSRYLLNEAR